MLTRAERVRLEALALAITYGQTNADTTQATTIERAKIFEEFIKAAREDA